MARCRALRLYRMGAMDMTTAEFRKKAEQLGLSEWEISGQIAIYEKFLREGLTPIPFETVLEARQKSSCLEVFEMHNIDRGGASLS